jgi:hypothetical protein
MKKDYSEVKGKLRSQEWLNNPHNISMTALYVERLQLVSENSGGWPITVKRHVHGFPEWLQPEWSRLHLPIHRSRCPY